MSASIERSSVQMAVCADNLAPLERSVATRDKTIKGWRAKRHLIVILLLLVLSVPLRVMNLQAPFTGEHEFRQTQTALSVWEMRAHGICWLHPKLPLFGPPWECPFEYPVFQIAAAVLDSVAPWKNLDISIRLTNLAFFYLTAVALYLLTRLLFKDKNVALFATAVFLFSPYDIFWSRTSMIESAATFFGLAYLGSFIRWTQKPGWTAFSICLLFGILGCLTKITTFIIPAFVCTILTGLQVIRLREHLVSPILRIVATRAEPHSPLHSNGSPGLRSLLLMCMLIIPLAAGQWYTKFGDGIKEKTDYTNWLSSSGPEMKRWAYGTLDQRLDLRKWDILRHRIQEVVTPCFAVALVVGFFVLPFRIRGFGSLPKGNFLIGCSLVLAPILAISLLFNLYYVHSYYLNACAPFFAACAGAGLWVFFKVIRSDFMKLLYVLVAIGLWLGAATPQLAKAEYAPSEDSRVTYLNAASKLIPPEEPVIILSGTQWSSFAPYYLKRRALMAMMIDKPVNIQKLIAGDYFKKNGFHWLLLEGDAPGMKKLASEIMQKWKDSRPAQVPVNDARYELYSLSDE